MQLATVIVVAAVAAGAFVLSYAGVHAIALQSGVPVSLARYYPAVFDAVLVIACAAAPLRDAGWWTRFYTWFVILLVIGLLGAMDAVHAMNVALPRREAAGVVAVLPWLLLLLAFSLWLAVLQHYRRQPVQEAPSAPSTQLALPAPPLAELPPLAHEPSPGSLPEESVDRGNSLDALFDEAPGEVHVEAPAEHTRDEAQPDQPEPEQVEPDLPEPEQPESESAIMGPENAPQDPAPDEITEVPGITYATGGPRLRRVRSLPAPPVDDE